MSKVLAEHYIAQLIGPGEPPTPRTLILNRGERWRFIRESVSPFALSEVARCS